MRPFAVLLPLILLSMPVAAQDPPAVPATLTLEQALEIARERNPEYRKALNNIEASAAQERTGWAGFLPSVNASMSLSGRFSRQLTGTDFFGNPITSEDPLENTNSSSSQGLGLSLTLFDGFATLNRWQAARAGSDAASAAARAERVRIEAQIAREFYDALGAQRVIVLEERLLASARERLDATRQMLRVARSNPEDVLGAEVDVAGAEQAVRTARNDARKSVMQLAQTMGVGSEIAFELGGGLPEPFDPSGLDADRLVAMAMEGSPEIHRLVATLAGAENQVDVARAARWPSVSLGANAGRGIGLDGLDALSEFMPSANQNYNFSLSVSVPLFDRFQTSSQITSAEVDLANAREDVRAARIRIEREVRAALLDVENAYFSVQLAERSAELARERVRIAEERYQSGAQLDFTALQQIIDQAAQAERNALNARVAFAQLVATLEEQVGAEVRP